MVELDSLVHLPIMHKQLRYNILKLSNPPLKQSHQVRNTNFSSIYCPDMQIRLGLTGLVHLLTGVDGEDDEDNFLWNI